MYNPKNPIPSEIVREDESHLFSAPQKGDPSAFEELVKCYERRIFRITRNITGNQEDAEDRMQEAFLKAYAHFGGFQRVSWFYAWLVRIAVNESLMRLRRPGQTISRLMSCRWVTRMRCLSSWKIGIRIRNRNTRAPR